MKRYRGVAASANGDRRSGPERDVSRLGVGRAAPSASEAVAVVRVMHVDDYVAGARQFLQAQRRS